MKGGIGQLMKQAQQMQADMQKAQQEMANLTVVGESGAGKSTIGNGVVQLLSAPGRVSSGEVYLDGTLISEFKSQSIS